MSSEYLALEAHVVAVVFCFVCFIADSRTRNSTIYLRRKQICFIWHDLFIRNDFISNPAQVGFGKD